MIRRTAAAIALAALVGGAIAVTAAAPAAASSIPIVIHFGTLSPGVTAHASQRIEIPLDAVVASAAWTREVEPAGTVWSFDLCRTDTECRPIESLLGERVAKGTYDVRVSVTLPVTTAQAALVERDGRLQLVQDDGALAETGATAPWLLGVAGALLAGCGALLLARRRREADE